MVLEEVSANADPVVSGSIPGIPSGPIIPDSVRDLEFTLGAGEFVGLDGPLEPVAGDSLLEDPLDARVPSPSSSSISSLKGMRDLLLMVRMERVMVWVFLLIRLSLWIFLCGNLLVCLLPYLPVNFLYVFLLVLFLVAPFTSSFWGWWSVDRPVSRS